MFANQAFLVVDKPAGWLSVPSRMGAADPRPCVGRWLETQVGERLWPVHRLDLEVTGLLLFARSAAAHRQANSWFERRLVGKTYDALSEAVGEAPSPATWRCQLQRGKKRAFISAQGKPCETRAEVVAEHLLGPLAVRRWHLAPLTGRPHQLRFELARHGAPILGDELYGSTRSCPDICQWSETPTDGLGSLGDLSFPDLGASPAGSIALRCVSLDFSNCLGAADLGLPMGVAAKVWLF